MRSGRRGHGTRHRTGSVIVGTAVLAALSASSAWAQAQCCSGFAKQCGGTKSIWCVQNGAPAGTLPSKFCAYGDEVISQLETLFNLQAPSTFEFDVEWPANGGAHTGTDCGTFGDGVTGDAFTGFYGYLLPLHEAINDWTGMVAGGWPTDFWADHISAFPNEMDWRVLGALGSSLNDANLSAASSEQKARFWPGGDSEDSRVQMFDNMFTLPKMGNGFLGFARIFGYVHGDGLDWDNVATNGANPDERRSEYVAAYLSLGAGRSVLPIMQTPPGGYKSSATWPVCNGKWDGKNGDPNPSYTCDETKIDAIATAHCAIAANGRPAADLKALQTGHYDTVKSGACGASCPEECGCKTATNECVAPWLGDAPPNDAGTPAVDGSGAEAGGESASGGARADGGGGGSVGASSGGASSGGSGNGTSTAGAGSSGASAGQAAGTSSSADGGGNGDASNSSSSGCSCTTMIGSRTHAPASTWIAGGGFAAILVRRRARRP